jgi:hypothetical protein
MTNAGSEVMIFQQYRGKEWIINGKVTVPLLLLMHNYKLNYFTFWIEEN